MEKRFENEENAMNCSICQGELEVSRVTRIQQYDGRWYMLENLPALVCDQCG